MVRRETLGASWVNPSIIPLSCATSKSRSRSAAASMRAQQATAHVQVPWIRVRTLQVPGQAVALDARPVRAVLSISTAASMATTTDGLGFLTGASLPPAVPPLQARLQTASPRAPDSRRVGTPAPRCPVPDALVDGRKRLDSPGQLTSMVHAAAGARFRQSAVDEGFPLGPQPLDRIVDLCPRAMHRIKLNRLLSQGPAGFHETS